MRPCLRGWRLEKSSSCQHITPLMVCIGVYFDCVCNVILSCDSRNHMLAGGIVQRITLPGLSSFKLSPGKAPYKIAVFLAPVKVLRTNFSRLVHHDFRLSTLHGLVRRRQGQCACSRTRSSLHHCATRVSSRLTRSPSHGTTKVEHTSARSTISI
jgi:hypothetical protein